jgi:hypothetical protein
MIERTSENHISGHLFVCAGMVIFRTFKDADRSAALVQRIQRVFMKGKEGSLEKQQHPAWVSQRCFSSSSDSADTLALNLHTGNTTQT